MNKIYTLLFLLGLIVSVQQLRADEWTYDFEDFAALTGGAGSRTEMNVTLNGLDWHMYGVTNSGSHWSDWMNGTTSLKVFGENCSGATEITNITLQTKRNIGSFKFWLRVNERWMGLQVPWIVQWTEDGSNWVTAGESFTPGSEPVEIVREINLKNVRVRIVREDYLSYDYTNPVQFFAYAFHIDDMTITDVPGEVPAGTLSSSVGDELNFGEVNLNETVEKTFSLSYSGLKDVKPTLTLQGDNAEAFTIIKQETTTTGQDEVSISCKAMRRGDHSASIKVSYGEIKRVIQLKAIGKKVEMYSGGSGTEADPYLITNPQDLIDLSQEVENNKNPYVDTYFKMTNDISMKDIIGFRPIGNNWDREASDPDRIRPFSGVFDGGGFAIKDLSVNWATHMFSGLFGIVRNATIKNLSVSKSRILGGSGLGAIVGISMGSFVLENCHTTDDVVVWTNSMYVGGIIGGALKSDAGKTSRISKCTNAAKVNGEYGGTGGIIGCASQANLLIERCGNSGTITDQFSSLGGIVGVVSNITFVTDCYNVGLIEAINQQQAEDTFAGGIVGANQLPSDFNHLTDIINISNCYSIGRAKNLDQSFHPIFNPMNGYSISQSKLSNNYYSREVNDMAYDQDLDSQYAGYAVQDVALAEMKTEAFLVKLNPMYNVWCFVSGSNDGYPVPLGDGSIRSIDHPQEIFDIQLHIIDGQLIVEGDYTALYLYDLRGVQIDPSHILERGAYVARLVIGDQEATYKLLY